MKCGASSTGSSSLTALALIRNHEFCSGHWGKGDLVSMNSVTLACCCLLASKASHDSSTVFLSCFHQLMRSVSTADVGVCMYAHIHHLTSLGKVDFQICTDTHSYRYSWMT